MRRRQINALRQKLGIPAGQTVTPALIAALSQQPAPIKGACRHCGKQIGRGIHIHERSCNGNAG